MVHEFRMNFDRSLDLEKKTFNCLILSSEEIGNSRKTSFKTVSTTCLHINWGIAI